MMEKASVRADGTVFTLENRWIRREIRVDEQGVLTRSFRFDHEELLKENRTEFMIAVDRKLLTSFTKKLRREVDGQWEEHRNELFFESSEISDPDDDYRRLDLNFSYREHRITLRYEIANHLPAMRKRVIFTSGRDDTMIDTLIFDDTPIAPGDFGECEFYRNMQPVPCKRGFTCSGDTDFLRIYNPRTRKGFYLGNTAPGVLRYFMTYLSWHDIAVGYNCESAPFRKYLDAGERFESAEALTCFYRGDADGGQDEFRKVVRSRLPKLEDPADIMYCSWIPLNQEISETIICDMADRAAACGFTVLVIDDGWFTQPNWRVDPAKFPDGLKKVADHIHGRGLKFGLWFNIGTSYGMADDVERNAARLDDGAVKRLGFDYSKALTVQCFGSEHRDRMTRKLHQLASDYGVDYFKMDFSSISSPYGILPWGCHAHDHQYHRGFSDSFIAMYEGFAAMRAELKKLHPGLLLDFSFETFGLNDPSIGALSCSELNHLSNLNCTKPDVEAISKVRRDFYNQSAALPPERLMHGLPALNEANAAELFLTSLCGMPLVSGDLRSLSEKTVRTLAELSRAYRAIARPGALTGFEVLDLAEPLDGFRRFADDGREFLCVFHSGAEPVRVSCLKGFANVLTGDASGTLGPGACGMFVRRDGASAGGDLSKTFQTVRG